MIDNYNNDLFAIESKIQRVEEDLVEHKQSKRFLDILSIEAGLKKM